MREYKYINQLDYPKEMATITDFVAKYKETYTYKDGESRFKVYKKSEVYKDKLTELMFIDPSHKYIYIESMLATTADIARIRNHFKYYNLYTY